MHSLNHKLKTELLACRKQVEDLTAERDALAKKVEGLDKKLTGYLVKNNDLWNGMMKLPGGVEVARKLSH